MIEIQTPSHKILHTGDMDTRTSPNTIGAKPVDCDILLLESTYSGKEHPNRIEEEARFVAKVIEVVERGGVAIIPAFASGRGQDIIRILHNSGYDLNVHYDGMGKAVSQIWLEHPEHLQDPNSFEQAFKWTRRVRSKSDRKRALEADVIVTTSGMLDGGPALWYLNRLRNDSRSAVLFTGYQAEGSGGRQLIEKGSSLFTATTLRSTVKSIDSNFQIMQAIQNWSSLQKRANQNMSSSSTEIQKPGLNWQKP